MRILIVEDDRALSDALAFHFRQEGFQAERCYDGNDALLLMRQHAYDLVILDRMLPGQDGVSALKQARRAGCTAPVLMLTALGAVDDRIGGLDSGADDYLTKPFEIKELLARARALCRRPSGWSPAQESLTFGDVSVDVASQTLHGPGDTQKLTNKEAQLMEALVRAKGQTIPREALFLRVWGTDTPVEDGNLDSYIHFLRRRLAAAKCTAGIRTVRGVGYRLEKP